MKNRISIQFLKDMDTVIKNVIYYDTIRDIDENIASNIFKLWDEFFDNAIDMLEKDT